MRQRKRRKTGHCSPALIVVVVFVLLFVITLLSGKPTTVLANEHSNTTNPTVQLFSGLQVSSFKLTEVQGDYMLLGSLNVIHNVSLASLREVRRIDWPPSVSDHGLCRLKGKSEKECQNYIRLLKLENPHVLFVCGTNAYRPMCRRYLIKRDSYELLSEAIGDGHCPHQETQNATGVFVDEQLYSATSATFSGSDALIYREPLRTEQFNSRHLNSPNFVSSFQYESHVYFLFREQAIEYNSATCGSARVYSRIGRVCIHDKGDNRLLWTTFAKTRLNCSIPGETPFYFDELQAATPIVYRLSPKRAQPSSDLFYATFSTPANSIGGSAICAYRMSDVLAAFEDPYRAQAESLVPSLERFPSAAESASSEQPKSDIGRDAASTCARCAPTSAHCSEEAFRHMRENPLIEQALNSLWSQPLLAMATLDYKFTQIAVHAQVAPEGALGASSKRTDVLFVATDDGRVLKLVNKHHFQSPIALAPATQPASTNPNWPHYPSMTLPPDTIDVQESTTTASSQLGTATTLPAWSTPGDPKVGHKDVVSGNTVIVEELLLFDSNTPIVNLLIYNPASTSPQAGGIAAKLIAITSGVVKSIPLSRCERAATCSDCLDLRDPYCAWNDRLASCVNSGASINRFVYSTSQTNEISFDASKLITESNTTLGWWSQCPQHQHQQQQVNSNKTSEGVQNQNNQLHKSIFSAHLQTSSRYDFASGHRLAQVSLVSLIPKSSLAKQQVSSECLSYCGGVQTVEDATLVEHGGQTSGSDPRKPSSVLATCAKLDLVQSNNNNNIDRQASPIALGALSRVSIAAPFGLPVESSQTFYLAVISCAMFGLILGALSSWLYCRGRNRKQNASICSSNESNLYMASTSSHVGNNLFYSSNQLLSGDSSVGGSTQSGVSLLHHSSPQRQPPLPPKSLIGTPQQVLPRAQLQSSNCNNINNTANQIPNQGFHHRATQQPSLEHVHSQMSYTHRLDQPQRPSIFNLSPNYPS